MIRFFKSNKKAISFYLLWIISTLILLNYSINGYEHVKNFLNHVQVNSWGIHEVQYINGEDFYDKYVFLLSYPIYFCLVIDLFKMLISIVGKNNKRFELKELISFRFAKKSFNTWLILGLIPYLFISNTENLSFLLLGMLGYILIRKRKELEKTIEKIVDAFYDFKKNF